MVLGGDSLKTFESSNSVLSKQMKNEQFEIWKRTRKPPLGDCGKVLKL